MLTLSLRRGKTPLNKNGLPRYNTKLHWMVRFQFLRSGECGVYFCCHYSQFYFDLGVVVLSMGLIDLLLD